jgi:hypothetical protein
MQGAWAILTVFVAVGAAMGWLGSFAVAPKYEASAVMMCTPASFEPGKTDDGRAVREYVARLASGVTSRSSLAALINDPRLNLYPVERRVEPLEDVEDLMRRDIAVSIRPRDAKKKGPQAAVFVMRFRYSDPGKAVATVNGLIRRFLAEATSGPVQYFLDTLDAPVLPKRPVFPARGPFALAGLSAGLVLGLIALGVRRWILPRRRALRGSLGFVGIFMGVGLAVGLGLAFRIPNLYEAKGVAQLEGTGRGPAGSANEAIMQAESELTSRQSLANLMVRLDLYREERRSQSLEEVADAMRRSIKIQVMPRAPNDIFAVSFRYPDRRAAVDTTNVLISQMAKTLRENGAGFRLAILDAPAIPQKPSSPKRPLIAGAGILFGLILALITLAVRGRPVAGPELQSA